MAGAEEHRSSILLSSAKKSIQLPFCFASVCGGEDEDAAGTGGHCPEPVRPGGDCARFHHDDPRSHIMDQAGGPHIPKKRGFKNSFLNAQKK
jgi:hypothetical protein